MKIQELIKSLGRLNNNSVLQDFRVRGISCNSKLTDKDHIFVAINGIRENGNKFIGEAIERGARAVITQDSQLKTPDSNKADFIFVKDARKALGKLAAEFYGNPSSRIKVVGITGTNGKTTITYLIERILKEAGANPSVIGTINYRFNGRSYPSKNTTPGPLELQSMLSEMLKNNIDYAAVEVSSHALDQERVCGINFHSAIFTNLTQDHLDYHGTLRNYFNAKARLFENMSEHAFAVINNDSKFAPLLKKITKAEVITYGIKKRADVRAADIKTSVTHTEFQLSAPGLNLDFKTGLLGMHNVYNILAAVAWAIREGIGAAVIRSGIEQFSSVPGRLEKIDSGKGFSVFVDYAHTDDALKNVLKTLKPLAKKRIIVVFGCGGERDKAKRPKMGMVVSNLAGYAIITNDNPRSENPLKIIEDIKRGIKKNNYCVITDRFKAIEKSLSLAEPGDIVLVAGKGHETYQIIKDKTLHFDDREAVRECLRSMSC